MSSAVKSQLGERMVYDNARKALMSADLDKTAVANAVLSQSYIRLEQPIAAVAGGATSTSTLFEFPMLNNQTNQGNPIRPTEKRLNQQDAFFASGIQVYLFKAASANDSAIVLETYPNAVKFPTGSANLYQIYNGQLTITINNSVIVTGRDMNSFLKVRQTQLTAATNSPIDEFYGEDDNVLQPNIVFVGTKNNVVKVLLPAAVGAIDTFTYIAVKFSGVLAQNVTLMS